MDSQTNLKQLRIGIVIASLKTGGAERMALALAHALLVSGTDVRLYCLDSARSMPLPGTEDEQRALERRIYLLGAGNGKQSTLTKALAFPKLHRELEKSIRAEELDLVISFMERANILNLLGDTKIPRIISIRKHLTMALSDKDPLKRTLVKAGYSWLLKRASNINFNSSEAAQDLSTLYPSNKTPVSVINNFYDESMLQRATAALNEEELSLLDGNSIVTCGRLVPVKSQAALVRAFAPVAQKVPDSKLIIVGDGPVKAKLESLIDELKLKNRVFLTGQKTNPYAWVSRAKVFALSSKAEGFPNALLEAMALSRPVISTDCHSGPRELLSPDSNPAEKTDTLEFATYGILTPPQETSPTYDTSPLTAHERALAEAMERLLIDDELREEYGQKAAQRSLQFTRDSILDQWHKLISDTLAV
ncbi:glycosyltransferase [Pontibacterium granulatum]|uniref:glycosyltransferase n=1 Tax=Pontibacterium granulatum TaxID=2036029 RepID=UPI00249BC80E|nr:glycosyltransferase [Pontibacterium granulatum]MDI3325751.1 glycosyltransferase [Pontibacterium granulatum]